MQESIAAETGGFQYTYSAPQQQEVRKIREKYLPREESKLDQLRRKKGTALSLVTGVLSALILGVGMCCCMVWGGWLFALGIVIGVAGIAGVSMAYPLYTTVTKRERERIAPEILRLTEELRK